LRQSRGEPRPAEFRDAFVGALLVLVGAYVGGGAVWTWLAWPDEHLDPSRIYALIFGGLMILFGYTSITTWLAGDWFTSTDRVGHRQSDGSTPPPY